MSENRSNAFKKEVEKRLIDLDMEKSALASKMGISSAYLCDLLNGSRNSKVRIEQIEQILSLRRKEAANG